MHNNFSARDYLELDNYASVVDWVMEKFDMDRMRANTIVSQKHGFPFLLVFYRCMSQIRAEYVRDELGKYHPIGRMC